MLTSKEKKEIEELAVHYDFKRAASIEALKVVQRQRGWVSDESVKDIAAELGMTPDEVDSVATFYNLILRKQVGRHVIYLCDSVSCWVMGCDQIAKHIKARLGIGLGETTKDGRFTLIPVCCLGTCDHAPALMIDQDTHQDVSIEKLEGILGKYQ